MALWYMQTKNNALDSLLCLVFLPKRCFVDFEVIKV